MRRVHSGTHGLAVGVIQRAAAVTDEDRQLRAADGLDGALDAALTSLRQGMTPDAVLVDVEAAMSALGEVTGRTMREDITNRIFERFCVGK